MFKSISAVTLAAATATVLTLLSAPGGRVDAKPAVLPAALAAPACKQRPWPYLNCVGTPYGDPRIRLVTTDRLD